jgi:hypothetical protein
MEFPLHITIKKPFGFDGFKFWRQSKKNKFKIVDDKKTASRPDSTQNPAYTFDTLKQIVKSVAQSHLDTIVSHH